MRAGIVFWLHAKLYNIADNGINEDNANKISAVINMYDKPTFPVRWEFVQQASKIF